MCCLRRWCSDLQFLLRPAAEVGRVLVRCGWKHFLLLWVLFVWGEWMGVALNFKTCRAFKFWGPLFRQLVLWFEFHFSSKTHIHAWILRVSLSAFYSGNSLQSFYFIHLMSSVELKHYFFPVFSPVKAGLESALSIFNCLETAFSEGLENGPWYRTPDPALILPKSLEWAAEPGLTVVLFLIY